MKYIVVPTDFSVCSINALRIAVDLAERVNRGIILCHVYQFYANDSFDIGTISEIAQEKERTVKQFYNFYSLKLLPLIGKLISKDDRAYRYLPESVKAFPEEEEFLKILTESGFKKVWQRRLTFGICSIYCGLK